MKGHGHNDSRSLVLYLEVMFQNVTSSPNRRPIWIASSASSGVTESSAVSSWLTFSPINLVKIAVDGGDVENPASHLTQLMVGDWSNAIKEIQGAWLHAEMAFRKIKINLRHEMPYPAAVEAAKPYHLYWGDQTYEEDGQNGQSKTQKRK